MPSIPLFSDVWTSAGIGLWAAALISLIAIAQNVSQIPLPTGSTARNVALAIGAAIVVSIAALQTGQKPNVTNVVGAVFTWIDLVGVAVAVHTGAVTLQANLRAKRSG